MNGYLCCYGEKEVSVYAETSYEAQRKAMVEFQKMFPRKKIKSFQVDVYLVEKGGNEVVHIPSF